jgi:hypothetical protein
VRMNGEELDGRAVSTLGVRSRKLSTGLNGQNVLTMRNTADVTGGKPIAVLLQSISGVSAVNPLVFLIAY